MRGATEGARGVERERYTRCLRALYGVDAATDVYAPRYALRYACLAPAMREDASAALQRCLRAVMFSYARQRAMRAMSMMLLMLRC